MNWDAVGAIGEIVGALGVIATLGYLARQVKENSGQMKVGAVISINQLINDAYDPIYNNDRNIRIWTQGLAAPSELNAEDKAIFGLFMARLVNVLLTAFSQRRYGTLEDEVFVRYAGTLNALLGSPGGNAWLNEMGGSELLSDEVREFIESDEARLHWVSHQQLRSDA